MWCLCLCVSDCVCLTVFAACALCVWRAWHGGCVCVQGLVCVWRVMCAGLWLLNWNRNLVDCKGTASMILILYKILTWTNNEKPGTILISARKDRNHVWSQNEKACWMSISTRKNSCSSRRHVMLNSLIFAPSLPRRAKVLSRKENLASQTW